MLGRFVLVSLVVHFAFVALCFHLGLGCCALLLGARWVRSQAWKKATRTWVTALARDCVQFGIALLVFAMVGGAVLPVQLDVGFGVLRLLCQGVFGEGVLLAVFVAVLHARHGAGRRAAVVALPALLLLAVYFEAYHREPHALHLRTHTLDLSYGRGDARVLRLLHLSDFQTNQIGPYERRVIQRAREQGADLIVFTGDYIQERLAPTRTRVAQEFTALLQHEGLQAPLGVFAVSGDVDHDDWEQMFAGTGVTILDNRSTRIALPGGRHLSLIGMDVETSLGDDAETVHRLVAAAPPEDLRIVIGHRPDYVRALAEQRDVDLALAGHTHGGQVVLPFFGPPLTISQLPRQYAGGLNNYQGPLHVCRGTGMERRVAPQIRFLCPPEICMLQIRY